MRHNPDHRLGMYCTYAISISVTRTNSFFYRDHAFCIGTMDQLREQNQNAPFKVEDLVLNEYGGGKKTDGTPYCTVTTAKLAGVLAPYEHQKGRYSMMGRFDPEIQALLPMQHSETADGPSMQVCSKQLMYDSPAAQKLIMARIPPIHGLPQPVAGGQVIGGKNTKAQQESNILQKYLREDHKIATDSSTASAWLATKLQHALAPTGLSDTQYGPSDTITITYEQAIELQLLSYTAVHQAARVARHTVKRCNDAYNDALQLAPALKAAGKSVGVDSKAGTGTLQDRKALQAAAVEKRAQEQAKLNAASLAKTLSAAMTSGFNSLKRDFRSAGRTIATLLASTSDLGSKTVGSKTVGSLRKSQWSTPTRPTPQATKFLHGGSRRATQPTAGMPTTRKSRRSPPAETAGESSRVPSAPAPTSASTASSTEAPADWSITAQVQVGAPALDWQEALGGSTASSAEARTQRRFTGVGDTRDRPHGVEDLPDQQPSEASGGADGAYLAQDSHLEERHRGRSLVTSREEAPAATQDVSNGSLLQDGRRWDQLHDERHPSTATASPTKAPAAGSAYSDPMRHELGYVGSCSADHKTQVVAVRATQTQTVLLTLVFGKEVTQGGILCADAQRFQRTGRLAAVPERQAPQPLHAPRVLQAELGPGDRRNDSQGHLYGAHGRMGSFHPVRTFRRAVTLGRLIEPNIWTCEPTARLNEQPRSLLLQDRPLSGVRQVDWLGGSSGGIAAGSTLRHASDGGDVRHVSDASALAEAVPPSQRVRADEGCQDGDGHGRQHGEQPMPSAAPSASRNASGRAHILRIGAVDEGEGGPDTLESVSLQRLPVLHGTNDQGVPSGKAGLADVDPSAAAEVSCEQEAGQRVVSGSRGGSVGGCDKGDVRSAPVHAGHHAKPKDHRQGTGRPAPEPQGFVQSNGQSHEGRSGGRRAPPPSQARQAQRQDAHSRPAHGSAGDHGLVGLRLGRSAAPNLRSTKPSDPLSAISDFVAHHVERLGRDADGRVGSDGVRKRIRLEQLPGPPLHGQRICNLHIQQDGVQGQGHQQGDGVLLGVVPEEADNDSRVIHPWSPHRGRRAKSEARRALGVHPGAASLRPVVQLGNLVTYLPANRSANIRPVRNTHQLEDAPLRESAPRPILHDSGLPEASTQAPTGYAVRVSPTQDPDAVAGEGTRGASDGAASVRGLETNVPTTVGRDAGVGATDDTMDAGNSDGSTSRLQTSGSPGGSTPERSGSMVEVAALWVRDLRRHCRAQGVQDEVTCDIVDDLARLPTPAAVYERWRAHCQGIRVDHLTAPTGAIVNALNGFATALHGEAKAKGSPYHFEKHIRFVTAWYTAVTDNNVTSDRVRKMRKNLRSDPTCVGKSVPPLENFHTGDVWKALLQYESTELRAVLDDGGAIQSANSAPILTEYAADQLLLFSRRMFTWATRSYNCARSADAAGLRLRGSFQPTTRRGTVLELADCGIATLGSVTFFDTKTYKNQWSPTHIVNAPRSKYIGGGPYVALQYSYWYRLQQYINLSAAHRAEMPPGEDNHLLISARKCGRQTTRRKNHVTGEMDVHVPPCGGKCNKYHPLTPDAIASDVKWCLKLAGASTKYTAHSTRGCAEMCIIHGARLSKQFGPEEARLRARHSQDTQDKYYRRAPNARWLSTIRSLRKGVVDNMLPEEFIIHCD